MVPFFARGHDASRSTARAEIVSSRQARSVFGARAASYRRLAVIAGNMEAQCEVVAAASAVPIAEGPAVRERMRKLLDGGPDSPLPVDDDGVPDPAYLARLRSAMDDAARAGDFRLATGLQDLLFAVEPRPPLTLEEAVGGVTLEEKAAFFVKHGCIVVPRLFEDGHLARLQRTWSTAQSAARAQWEEAKSFGVLPQPLDGIYFANQRELNIKFPALGGAGFGRKWCANLTVQRLHPHTLLAGTGGSIVQLSPIHAGVSRFDIPATDFYAEAASAGGDPALLDLLDPPKLMEVLEAICGGTNIRCIHIQPRTVPPEDEGGYTSWHRDMSDVNSVANSFPTDGRVVKAIVYLHDCPPHGGANGVVVGSHRLPFGPREVYGTQFYDGTEATRHKALPLEKMPNALAFTLPAGWAAIFDITSWHTALGNHGPGERQNMIQTYVQSPSFSSPAHVGHGIPAPMLHELAKLGRFHPTRRKLLGLPDGDLKLSES